MSNNKSDASGVDQNSLEQQGRKDLEAALAGGTELAKQAATEEIATPPETPPTPATGSDANTETVDTETEKYLNVLTNTFGIEEGKIDDTHIKLAKSYLEAQSGMTKAKQSLSERQALIQNIEGVFEKAPDLYQQFTQVATGKQPENLSPQGNQADNPNNNVGQLNNQSGSNVTVNEQTLITSGYLDPNIVNGLDDISRLREVAKAEIAYERDRALNEYKSSLQRTQQELTQQQTLQQQSKTNSERIEKGWNNVITNYGVDLSKVDDNTFRAIEKNIAAIRDVDGLISEDAVEIAVRRVLPKEELKNAPLIGKKSLEDIADSGVSINKGSAPAQKLTGKDRMMQELNERAQRHFQNTTNPKSYKQR